jgi:hypothetical protein
MLGMRRQERLRGKIDGLRERIRELELRMQGVDSTNMNQEILQSIATQFERLISDVMGKNSYTEDDWKWKFDYVFDYDKVLDYVMHRDSSLTLLETSGLFMLEIPLDIIDVWIQFVRILCSLSSSVAPPIAKIINERLDVVKRTVDIMRQIILAAKVKSSGSTYQHRNALSTYGYDIIRGVRDIIAPFERVEHYLSSILYNRRFFRETVKILPSFMYIGSFVKTTFTDKVKRRFEKEI